jgi:REP element-mobilizing transposase RayT
MRSTLAKGAMSFSRNRALIKMIVATQSKRASVRVISWANVGNHLHLHIQLPRLFRDSYCRFIRGLAGTIALKIQRASGQRTKANEFWKLRPFTRVLTSWREHLKLNDYIRLNHFEGLGFDRGAFVQMRNERDG